MFIVYACSQVLYSPLPEEQHRKELHLHASYFPSLCVGVSFFLIYSYTHMHPLHRSIFLFMFLFCFIHTQAITFAEGQSCAK